MYLDLGRNLEYPEKNRNNNNSFLQPTLSDECCEITFSKGDKT